MFSTRARGGGGAGGLQPRRFFENYKELLRKSVFSPPPHFESLFSPPTFKVALRALSIHLFDCFNFEVFFYQELYLISNSVTAALDLVAEAVDVDTEIVRWTRGATSSWLELHSPFSSFSFFIACRKEGLRGFSPSTFLKFIKRY